MERPDAPAPTPAEAAAALRTAAAARSTMASRVATPSWFFSSMGVAIGVHVGLTALAATDGAGGPLVAGLAVFAAVAGLQLLRFRRLNGVWLGGFASRVVLGGGTAGSVSYAVALGGAIWAASDGRAWLVVLWSAFGGAGHALSGRRWMRSYRGDPAGHARGESPAWLVLMAVAAAAGLVLLALNA